MVKAYLRYVEDACWGVITTGGGQVLPDPSGRYAIAPALESVVVWSIKTGELVRRLRPEVGMQQLAAEVTALALGADGETLAVGHSDGSVRLWHFKDGTERVTLTGHRSAVTTLRFSADSALLVSGGSDTMAVIWDVVGEAGLCKLRGHRGPVTDLCLLPEAHALATVSKDGMLKLWDLHTQHCVQTAAAPSGELWSVDAHEPSGHLLTGGAGGEVLLWRLERTQLADSAPAAPASSAQIAKALGGAEASTGWSSANAQLLGQLAMPSGAHVARLRWGLAGSCVGVQFADRTLQLLSAADASELKKRLKRREARLKKRAAEEAPPKEDEELDAAATAAFQPLTSFRAPHKLQSFAFLEPAADKARAEGTRPASARLLLAQRNNCVGIWDVELKVKGTATQAAGLEAAGHRHEPRCLALSGDDRQLASAADGEAKVWSVGSQQCLRTLGCGYGLSVLFLLSGRYVLVGTKAGALQVFSMATGEMVQEVADAHKGAIWSLALEPGAKGVVSASADKTIAQWSVAEKKGQARLELLQTHEVGDDALCARISPDGKHVAVALLDASVKVLFVDTFKLFLTLYGHKLPVLSISISSDSTLLVSGSADKSVKIWGLDFGDCHRSILAHSDSVTTVSFVRNTHYFFSGSKDGLIKYWDADSFEPIHTLRGHQGEVWGLSVSRDGSAVATVSRDRSLRLWRRSDEQVFVEEQKEAELEGIMEAGIEKQQQNVEAEEEEAAALGEGGAAESGSAGRRSLESVKGAERVLEALKTLDEEQERKAEHAVALARFKEKLAAGQAGEDPKPPPLVPNMLLLGLDEGRYLLKALTSVRTAELEQALMLLPFDVVPRLLRRLLPLLEEASHIELLARCACFVLRVHHKQIVANQSLLDLLRPLDQTLRARLSRERSMLGYNLAALGFVKRMVEDQQSNRFFVDAVAEMEERTKASSTAELRRKTAARELNKKAKKSKRN